MKIAIIGAGAAGCFCAVETKRRFPDAEVTVYEAGMRPMAKLAITGGGRCNLTNTFASVTLLKQVYPRGFRLMERLFHEFGPAETLQWFESEGIKLVAQEDECIFPVSQDAMEIVNLLLRRCREVGVKILTDIKLENIQRRGKGFGLGLSKGQVETDAVVIATGGFHNGKMLDGLNVETIPPVPSLFTLNIPDRGLRNLMGITVPNAVLSIPGTVFRSHGILLVTHWGLSGPAALKLSSYAARHLAECSYKAPLSINWAGLDEESLRGEFTCKIKTEPQKMIANSTLKDIPARLWELIVGRSGLRSDIRWAEIGTKGLSRLVESVLRDQYGIDGQTRFREEFVTCGGVSLSSVNPSTLEARQCPGLYFAGEVLDIDAITGGFNLQSAWTTAHIVATALASNRPSTI